ncbi:hypothetical protein CFP56_033835 [Quercus suber]|uniref:Uncharacterized protein n=1 Tax=Quercus suber TaxID=58331 RepID=A0AAW0LR92_QUESU
MLVQNKLGRTSFLKLVQKNKLLIQSGENRTMKIMSYMSYCGVSFTFDVAFQDLQDFLLSLNNILKLLRCGEFSESLITILSQLLYMAPSNSDS